MKTEAEIQEKIKESKLSFYDAIEQQENNKRELIRQIINTLEWVLGDE